MFQDVKGEARLTPKEVSVSRVRSREGFLLERLCNRCSAVRNFWTRQRGFAANHNRPLGIAPHHTKFIAHSCCKMKPGEHKESGVYFPECCSGMSPYLKGRFLRVLAYGTAPYVRFDFSKSSIPAITG